MRTALFMAAIPLVLLPWSVRSASCLEALDDFERKLNESSLAAREPDTYADLARKAAEAAELRDELLCMEQVGELNAALAQKTFEPAPEPASATTGPAPSDPGDAARPAAPLLLQVAPVNYDQPSSGEEDMEPGEDLDRQD